MKKLFTLFLGACLAFTFQSALAGGGPDAYGYVWLDSNDPGGPSISWVDTNSSWVQINGLADDNSVGQFQIGWAFHYYWADYTRIKIGSNGWISFDNTSNVASCFPTLPTPGGASDNLVCPLMGDLNFTSSFSQFPNPGEVWYWSNGVDSTIVSYYDVPFWVNAVPDWSGSNTFQVLFSGVDSSITYTYLNVDSTFTAAFNCNSNVVVGIENMTGNIGLQPYVDQFPPDNYAIKFYYPSNPLISVQDLTPSWNLNVDNGGVFFPTGVVPSLNTQIASVGNANVTTATTINAEIEDLNLISVYTASTTVPSLVAGANTQVNFSPLPNIGTAGQYFLNTNTVNSNDVNPGNNANSSEINMVDLSGPSARLSYAAGSSPTSAISWSGGADDDGAGVYMEPPVYPVTISSLEYFLNSGGSTDYYIAEIYDDDGLNGAPGTLLYSDTILPVNHTTNAWNTVTVSTPVTVTSGGFYVGWLQGGATVTLGAQDIGPLARRGYEILAGQWASYRDNSLRDIFIAVNITGYPCAVSAGFSNTAAANVLDFSNLSSGASTYIWDFGDGTTSTAVNPQHTYTQPGTYTVCLIAQGGCGNDTTCQNIQVNCPAPLPGFTTTSTGVTVDFLDQSSAGITSWLWDFGDGNTSTVQSPQHTYPAPGIYTVCLTVTNTCGTDSSCASVQVCALPLSNFQSQSDALTTDFQNLSTGGTSTEWDFGDGTTSTAQNPSHTYATDGTYTVCLITSNACSADTSCSTVSVCTPETPAFNFTQTGTFSFLFNDITPGSPTAWFWDFDDGTTSSLQNPSHAFPGFGAYNVALVITDACGTSDTTFFNVLIVGLEDGWNNGLVTVWPNPTEGSLAVQLTGSIPNGSKLFLRDLAGREIIARDLPGFTDQFRTDLDLSDLPAGMYFLELQGDDFRRTLKVERQ